jgi:hypothetical protein
MKWSWPSLSYCFTVGLERHPLYRLDSFCHHLLLWGWSCNVLWQSGAHLVDCIMYNPEHHNFDWFVIKSFSSAYCIFFLRNVNSICVVLQLTFSIFLFLPECVSHFSPMFFLSFKWHLSQPVVLIFMLTSFIILCLKSSLYICLCYIWKCACCTLFYHWLNSFCLG